MDQAAYSLIHKLAGDGEDYGYAPAVGTAAKFLPIPFSGPIAAGITAGAEGEGRDTNESMSRGLHAGAGNLLGSILGSLGGAVGGGALGIGSALIPAISRQRSWGGLGPKKFNFDPEIFAPAAATLGTLGAGVGGSIGNLYGAYKGTQAGIKHHRKAESERGEHAKEHYEGTKEKKMDETKEAQLRLIQKLAGVRGDMDNGKGQKAPTKAASSDMRSIIDDIIKGAEQNTFGRPVNIQADTEFTPIKMAEVSGMVVALSEKGYSVKEAAEYLGLTAAQVADIVQTVG